MKPLTPDPSPGTLRPVPTPHSHRIAALSPPAGTADDPAPGEARWLGDPLRRVKKLILLSSDFSDRERRDLLGWMADAIAPCGTDPWERASVAQAVLAYAQLIRLGTKALLSPVDSPEAIKLAPLVTLWSREYEKSRRLSGMRRGKSLGHRPKDSGGIYTPPRPRAPSELAAESPDPPDADAE